MKKDLLDGVELEEADEVRPEDFLFSRVLTCASRASNKLLGAFEKKLITTLFIYF